MEVLMCGIAGWIDFKRNLTNEDNIMNAMSKSMEDRGPDASGSWKTVEAYFVHRRLIVIDPENGKQPMVRKFKGAEYILTYNGELYNTNEIRSKLILLGHTFTGHSDTEVLLTAFMQWGVECLKEFNGIYAFGVWNTKTRTLFLARDRIGVKPLFYYPYENGIIFGSEIKTLLAHPYVKPQIDKNGIAAIMLLGPGRTPGDGVFKGVKELCPACYAIINDRGIKVEEYWKLKATPHNEGLEDTAEHVRYLLTDSIERQLVSDVPLCSFLSGGLDSSIISAVAANAYAKEGRTFHTYSIDYKNNDKNFQASAFQPDSDALWVDKMSDYIHTKHHKFETDTMELANALYDAVVARSLPGMADVDSSLLLFCKEVKQNFVVAFSGECADEIFGGYPWYHNSDILNKERFPWSQSAKLRAGLLRNNVADDIDPIEFTMSRYFETIGITDTLYSDSSTDLRMRQMFMLNIKWFMQTLLDRKDRMSMYTGLEVRVPFCDHRLMEYAYNIPWELKSIGDREKGLLRYAVKDLLPQEILTRKKSPYPKTHNPLYLSSVSNKLQEILNSKNSRITEILEPQKIQELIDTQAKCFDRPWYGQLMTDAQIIAYLLQVEYWLEIFDIEVVN